MKTPVSWLLKATVGKRLQRLEQAGQLSELKDQLAAGQLRQEKWREAHEDSMGPYILLKDRKCIQVT